jgi:tetratricopeptide (TPR) repeat protein
MIVRDAARTLRPCLESIRPWVDEMVVVDTGSRDDTRDIARQSGAQVFGFPWCDDFSAARNESLRHARGQWLFWMDADDSIDEANGRALRQLAAGPHEPQVLAYVVKVRCPGVGEDGVPAFVEVDHIKLFRRHPTLRFEFRIHEQLLPAIRRLGGTVKWSDVFVVHSGADTTPEGRRQKCARDLRILEKELQDRPDHPFALFNLGMTYADLGRHAEAVDALERSLAGSAPTDSQVRKTYALLVQSLTALGRNREAWDKCAVGLQHYPADMELLFRRGQLAHGRGDLSEAVRAFRAALAGDEQPHYASVDPALAGYKARRCLARVYVDLGRRDLAEVEYREILREVPSYRQARLELGQLLVQQGRLVTAEVEADAMAQMPGLSGAAGMLRADVAVARNDLSAARRGLEAAVAADPHDDEILDTLCRLLYEHFPQAEAVGPLLECVRRHPDDAAAHHNLGRVYLRLGDHHAAAASLREAARLRPHDPEIWGAFADALDALGKADDAAAARREADRARQRQSSPDSPGK